MADVFMQIIQPETRKEKRQSFNRLASPNVKFIESPSFLTIKN